MPKTLAILPGSATGAKVHKVDFEDKEKSFSEDITRLWMAIMVGAASFKTSRRGLRTHVVLRLQLVEMGGAWYIRQIEFGEISREQVQRRYQES